MLSNTKTSLSKKGERFNKISFKRFKKMHKKVLNIIQGRIEN